MPPRHAIASSRLHITAALAMMSGRLAINAMALVAFTASVASPAVLHGVIYEEESPGSLGLHYGGEAYLEQSGEVVDSTVVDNATSEYAFADVPVGSLTVRYVADEGFAAVNRDRVTIQVSGAGDNIQVDFTVLSWGGWAVSTNVDGPGVILIGPHILSGPATDAGTGTSWWTLGFAAENPARGIGCFGIPTPRGNAFLSVPYHLSGTGAPFNGLIVSIRPFSSFQVKALTLVPHGVPIAASSNVGQWLAEHPPTNGASIFGPAGYAESAQVATALPGPQMPFESVGPSQLSDSLFDIVVLVAASDSATRLDVQRQGGMIHLYGVSGAGGTQPQLLSLGDAQDLCFHSANRTYNYSINGVGGTVQAEANGDAIETPPTEVFLGSDEATVDSTVTENSQFWFGDLIYPRDYVVFVRPPQGFSVAGSDSAECSIGSDRAQAVEGFSIERSPEVGVPPAGLPKRLAVRVVRPNPVRLSAVVGLDVDRGGRGRISIVNVQGRTVSRTPWEELSPGRQSRTISAKDQTGMPLASGVYFIVLELEGASTGIRESATGKLVVLR